MTSRLSASSSARFAALALGLALAAPPARADQDPAPTFYKDVLPVFQRNCLNCHRSGEAAPMSLGEYSEVRPWTKSIKRTINERSMPPWGADPAHGKFSNEMRMTDAELATVNGWIAAGAPEGNPADAPPPLKFVEGWTIGEPDAVFTMGEDFQLAGEGPDEYQYFRIPTNFAEDRWLSAVEVRPGNREIVHHVIVFVEEPGKPLRQKAEEGKTRTNSFRPESPEKLQEIIARQEALKARQSERKSAPRDPAEMGIIGGMAPGMPAWTAMAGEGRLVKAGSTLVLQNHYHPSGTAGSDRTSVGVKFLKSPPLKRRYTSGIMNVGFAIPPGADNYEVVAEQTFKSDIQIVSFMPHLHLRGKAFEYRAFLPGGREEVLLSVPKYDFNWQLTYELAEPVSIPKGTTIRCTAVYDNSANNPANPDPLAVVRFGEPTVDEMMIGWFDYTLDSESLGREG